MTKRGYSESEFEEFESQSEYEAKRSQMTKVQDEYRTRILGKIFEECKTFAIEERSVEMGNCSTEKKSIPNIIPYDNCMDFLRMAPMKSVDLLLAKYVLGNGKKV